MVPAKPAHQQPPFDATPWRIWKRSNQDFVSKRAPDLWRPASCFLECDPSVTNDRPMYPTASVTIRFCWVQERMIKNMIEVEEASRIPGSLRGIVGVGGGGGGWNCFRSFTPPKVATSLLDVEFLTTLVGQLVLNSQAIQIQKARPYPTGGRPECLLESTHTFLAENYRPQATPPDDPNRRNPSDRCCPHWHTGETSSRKQQRHGHPTKLGGHLAATQSRPPAATLIVVPVCAVPLSLHGPSSPSPLRAPQEVAPAALDPGDGDGPDVQMKAEPTAGCPPRRASDPRRALPLRIPPTNR